MSNAEYENVEHKQSLAERHEGTVAIAAFATAQGGTVHYGIGPNGRRIGMQLGRNSLEDLANYIRQNTDPPQFPSIAIEGDENSAVVVVRIEESPIKPVWAFGRPYKRVGRTNQAVSREETQRLVDQTTGRTWDALPCVGLTTDALDRVAIDDFLRRSGQNEGTGTEEVLENLRLRLTDGVLSNATALLFAKQPRRFLTGAQVKCARFKGMTSVDFLDERMFEGNVLSQLDDALAFIARNIRQAIRITGRPEREIVPEYPDAALREAVTNAICHRDYTSSGTVQVRIYDDRLEVWNPARLAADLTVEQLYREHASRPPNRKLADAFYRARLIEQWGTGTLRMVSACEAVGLPRPEYRYKMGTFIVQFLAPTVEVVPANEDALNDRQREAISIVRENGSISTKQYAVLFHITDRQARRDLTELIELQTLRRVGHGPRIRYELSHY